MKRLFTLLLLSACIYGPISAVAGNYWKQVDAGQAPKNLQVLHPTRFLVYTMDEAALKLQMWNLSADPDEGIIISLPLPDGSYRDFKVWQTPMMFGKLAERYPYIKTFTGEAVGNHTITAKLDFTLFGFSAMVFDGENTFLIDPYDNYHDGFYMVHYKRDEVRDIKDRMQCLVKDEHDGLPGGEVMQTIESTLPPLAQKTFNGHNLRTYRLALSASNQYCAAVCNPLAPTIPLALSKMTTTMNRVNGVYNREFSVQMNFCDNEDTLIWPTNTGSINGSDPFNAINLNGAACLGANQTQCTNRIGSANYDLGHVFTTGGGGISALGVVCSSSQKARSCTGRPAPWGDGFDIDYVAHEMGHEFGSNHTFNNNADGSCGGNAVSGSAYEPGSGSTIMAYAGICSPDNIQPNSDAYFHASSLLQIQAKLAGSENVCAVITSTGNKLVGLPVFSASYKIPYKTPFELTAPTAIDSVADTLISYCWEQWNRGDFGAKLNNTYFKGPIFRSYNPLAYNPTRIFPKNSMVMAGNLVNVISDGSKGEKAPDTARYLTFKLTMRNILNGNGCFLFPDDTIHIDAISTGAANGFQGFKVTSQNTTGLSYPGASTQTVTWNVVGTDAAPVSAANVDIYMSKDGGTNWGYYLGTYPNNGSATVTLPNPSVSTTTARFKVKGAGNVFFNVNTKNFAVTYDPSIPVTPTSVRAITLKADDINIYPVPAREQLHISFTGTRPLNVVICNAIGQAVWKGTVANAADVTVAAWAKGVYYARFTDYANNNIVKPFVVQ
jgi:hypothetical protein